MLRKGPPKPRSRITATLLALFMLFGATTAIVTVTSAGVARADSTHQVEIGMPFTGQWAYNANVNPPYTDANSSHPSVHHRPGGGDWATDVYATEGTAVKLEVGKATGAVTFSWGTSSTTCGQSTLLNVLVDNVNVGWLYFAHLNSAVTSGAITSGMTLGTVKTWYASDGSVCNPGTHVHIEFKSTSNYACYVDNGHPGVTLNQGDGLGVLGSTNTSAQQPCSSLPTGPPSTIASLPDGTYIQATDPGNQNVYVMAGGAPMLVYAWANVGGQHAIQYTYTQAQISQQGLMYPRDGTVVRDAKTGALFVVAGGFPFGATSTSAVPQSYSSSNVYVNVDGNAIINGLRSQPADGTSIRDFSNGNPYVISGGAPVYVHDPTVVPYTNWVDIDHWDLANELKPYPTDGSTIIDNYGNVYVMAGGAAMKTMSTDTIPKYTSFAYVDNWTIVNLFPAFPRNGTVVRDFVHQNIYVVAGGSLMLISNMPYTSYINISDWSIANEFLQYPEDGTVIQDYVHKTVYVVVGGSPLYVTTPNSVPPADMTNAVPIDPNSFTQLLGYPMNGPFVVGYQSHRVYQIQNQTAVYIGNSSLITSTPIPVDDWAITNELHGS